MQHQYNKSSAHLALLLLALLRCEQVVVLPSGSSIVLLAAEDVVALLRIGARLLQQSALQRVCSTALQAAGLHARQDKRHEQLLCDV